MLIDPGALDLVVHRYGDAAVFVVVMLESAGLPLPGEAMLVAAAITAATTGALSLPGIVVAASAGAIFGDNLGFWLGRRFGMPLLLRHGHRVGLDAPRLKLGRYLFARHGGSIVFFGRFIALLRAFAALLAGANHYPWARFLVFNAAGGIVWATLYASAAFLFGRAIDRVAGPVGFALAGAALVAAVSGWRFLKRHEARLLAEAEQAMPGPLTP